MYIIEYTIYIEEYIIESRIFSSILPQKLCDWYDKPFYHLVCLWAAYQSTPKTICAGYASAVVEHLPISKREGKGAFLNNCYVLEQEMRTTS